MPNSRGGASSPPREPPESSRRGRHKLHFCARSVGAHATVWSSIHVLCRAGPSPVFRRGFPAARLQRAGIWAYSSMPNSRGGASSPSWGPPESSRRGRYKLHFCGRSAGGSTLRCGALFALVVGPAQVCVGRGHCRFFGVGSRSRLCSAMGLSVLLDAEIPERRNVAVPGTA